MNETELIRQSIAGNEKAFETILKDHYDMIFRVAYKWCGIQEDAEDIAQDVCIKLGRTIKSFKFESAFSSWLYRMTINTAKDYYKSKNRKRDHERAFENVHTERGGDNTVEEAASIKDIYRAIDALPTKLKETMLLIVDEGLNHKEASEVLGCAETTISWRLFLARKKLKKWVSNNG